MRNKGQESREMFLITDIVNVITNYYYYYYFIIISVQYCFHAASYGFAIIKWREAELPAHN